MLSVKASCSKKCHHLTLVVAKWRPEKKSLILFSSQGDFNK